MAIVRWDQLREFEEMSERLGRAYGRQVLDRPAEGGKEALTVPDWAPAVDIAETPEEFLIKAELPEVKKEDVKVTVENGVLRIEGERRQEKEEKTKKFHRIERAYGSFVRTFTVPDNIDEAKVSAEFKERRAERSLSQNGEGEAQGHRGQGGVGHARGGSPAASPRKSRSAHVLRGELRWCRLPWVRFPSRD